MSNIRTDGRSHRWGRLVVAPMGAVALVGLAACGTSTDASAASSGNRSSGTSSTAENSPGRPSDSEMAAYASCLAENGVTLPERPDGSGGPPDGGATPPSGAPTAPDGNGQTGGADGPAGWAPGEAPPGVDEDTWAAAQEACADLAPTPPDGDPSGT
jgi:hypothetical protein